jgi:hypothetical protein
MSKQQAKVRRSGSDDDVLTLFAALENTPPRQRRSDTFRDEERRLHRLLNL